MSYEPIKPESSHVGLRAERQMRDVPCIGLFTIAMILMFALLGCAFSEGSINNLYFGTDYLGNVCGQGTPQGVGVPQIEQNWARYKFLWYAVTMSNLGSSVTAWPAVCVESCPAPGFLQGTYLPGGGSAIVLFNSSATLNRCIPNLAGVPGAPPQASVSSSIAGTNSQAFALLKSHFWIVPVSLLIAMVLCGLWLVVLQHFLVPIIFITIGATFGALVLLGGFFLHLAFSTDQQTSKSSYEWYLAIGVLLLLGAFIFACVILYLRKDILVACDIIGEAGNIVKAVPTTMVVPIVSSIGVCLCVVLFTFVAINIYTVRDLETSTVANPAIQAATTTTTTAAPSPSSVSNTIIQIKTSVAAKWTSWGQWYNLFMFLWTVGLVHAIAFMTIAFCGVFWYWSRPGSDKFSEEGVLSGLHLTCRYHLGTLIFGSLLLAIVQMARIILNMLERRLQAYKEGNAPLRFLLCCAECLLACFERAVKFLNKNAYIVACMTGEGFFAAARHAMNLLLPRAGTVGAVSVIGEIILGVGKILIVAGVTVIGYFMLLSSDPDVTQGGKLFVLFVVVIVAYFIASIFLNVFAVSIDVLLLSYCYDLEQNNGGDRPYFFPDSLSHHVQSSTQLAADRQPSSSKGAQIGTTTTASGYSRLS